MASPGVSLFLDFDGVLFDTWQEAFFVAKATTELLEHGTVELDKIWFSTYAKDEKDLFYHTRTCIGPAWNYFFLMDYLKFGAETLLKANGLELTRAWVIRETTSQILRGPTESARQFERGFFEVRKKVRENFFEIWRGLNSPFPFLDELVKLKKKLPNVNISIISTKDRQTIETLLDKSLRDELQISQIWDRADYEQRKGKGEILSSIFAGSQPSWPVVFVDDSEKHIQDVKMKLPWVKCFCPDWGYVLPSKSLSDMREILGYVSSHYPQDA